MLSRYRKIEVDSRFSAAEDRGRYSVCGDSREIQDNCSLKRSDVKAVLAELSELLVRHLQDGHRVRLDGVGLLKLEIESDKVDSPEEFNVKKNIRNYRIHLLPESHEGIQALYDGIQLEPAVK